MAIARYSRRAEADLLRIALYPRDTWGMDQAERSLDQLERCAERLAANPGLGRSCDEVRQDLLRFEKGRHVFFYRRAIEGILISRVLHQGMLPEPHSFADAS